MDGRASPRDLNLHLHRLHPHFDKGEISIKSSDGVIFRIQRKNIEAYAGSFPLLPPDEPTTTICLPEPTIVLEVLFEFLFPKRYPDLEDKYFALLISIASAVEKYQVYAAMNPCSVRLRHFIKDHPAEILSHAIKCSYPALIEEAAQQLLFSPLVSAAGRLPSYAVLPWLKYRETVRGSIFNWAKAIDSLSNGSVCKLSATVEDCSIRPDCRNSASAWVAYLESILTRAALEREVEKPTKYLSENCNIKVEESCCWFYVIGRSIMEALEKTSSIALTDFLEEARERK